MKSKTSSNTYASLAYKVLKEWGKPLHYKNITKEILKVKDTKGKTPQQTLRVIITKDKKFVKVKRGIYGLKEWVE